jgi:beta-xylosidase
MDTGFANSSSFANAFKKKYRLNPSDYAEEYKKSLSPDDSSAFNAKNLSLRKAGYNEALSARAVKLLVGEGGQPALLKHPETIEIRVDAAKYQPHHKKTIRLINIGRANLLTDFDMRGQLLDMKTNLGIEYVRFWDIYDLFPCFDEYAGHTSGQYYFSKLDRVFDFLTENALHPFIELGFKPQILLRLKDGGHQYILTKPKDILFKTASEYEKFMRLFVEHFVNRYGAEELGKWYFEQWIDPREKSGDDLTNFFEVFEAAYRGIKGVSPNSCVGGGGISHGYDNYPAYFKAWHERAIHPDYISIYCYPYTAVLSGKEPVSINTQLNELKAAAFEGIPFIITEWSYAVSDRNPFNDTSFKASYMIHTLLSDILGDEMVGYWHGADLLSEYNDIDQILHGGNGLVSIDGIRKPAYYALYFINKLGEYMLYNGNDCRITTNGRKNFSILCCNYKPLNSDYFIKSEDDIKIDEMAGFYDNMQDKSLHITIENAANGIYKIKTHSINENHGSVYSEWKKLSYLKNVSKEEIDYLKSVCHPEITVQITEVTNNRLEFAASLTAQEMQYIHITLQ